VTGTQLCNWCAAHGSGGVDLRPIIAIERTARRPRAVDLLIAATATTAELPFYTRNIDDFRGIEPGLTAACPAAAADFHLKAET
jgi:hypothetical protein